MDNPPTHGHLLVRPEVRALWLQEHREDMEYLQLIRQLAPGHAVAPGLNFL